MNQLGPPSIPGQRRDLPGRVRRELAGMVEPGWMARASCVGVDGDEFFPDRLQQVPIALRRVCTECPVRRCCLASALLVGEYGIWAGTAVYVRERAIRMRLRAGEDPARVVEDLLRAAALPPGWLLPPGRVWSAKAGAA
jgi:hypothetical protein